MRSPPSRTSATTARRRDPRGRRRGRRGRRARQPRFARRRPRLRPADRRRGDRRENNLGGDPTVPTTTNFDTDFDLFDAYGDGDGGSGSYLAVDEIVYDPEGDFLEDEYVAFVNGGPDAIDLTGYEVSDAANNSYTFDASRSTPAIRSRCTPGPEPTPMTRCTGGGAPVWNNGDTVFVDDPDGNTVVEYSY
ncbi:lamin tail domain-containing protein [Halorubrum sp. 2020YC2]|uniref:lamin tail domain-containing protein n=1 Tax=Halorubrum sp. 2020YC2 TaxID=2836432 RepID=UPI001BE5E282|nr:lamin tail domain-containing protein [Halorubrum sp. 2020YC2]QWC18109.1 lamin tail domain-containing protein [Halorubrum sp. 2020YC2]